MIMPNKQISGKDRITGEYARIAVNYDRKWSFYLDATARETMARLDLRPTDQVLDVGCGTGILLHKIAVAYPKARLVGVDLTREMLAIARHRLSSRVALCAGSAEQLPFRAGRFDLVVSCNMFHYIRYPIGALQEIDRVLRPGGQILITDWCNDFITCRICDSYLRLFNAAHFKTYKTTECLALLKQTGYAEASIERYKINWFWELMTATAKKSTA